MAKSSVNLGELAGGLATALGGPVSVCIGSGKGRKCYARQYSSRANMKRRAGKKGGKGALYYEHKKRPGRKGGTQQFKDAVKTCHDFLRCGKDHAGKKCGPSWKTCMTDALQGRM